MPIGGFTADAPGLYLAVMHAGVVMAPAVGRLAAGEIVAGSEAEASAPCRVSRYGRIPFSPMPDHEGNPGFGARRLPADPDTTAPDAAPNTPRRAISRWQSARPRSVKTP